MSNRDPAHARSTRLRLLCLLCAGLPLARATTAQSTQTSGHPSLFADVPARNALVILMDDVAQADVDEVVADGFAPTLARIAAEGWTFEPTPGMRGGFASPVCSPGRYMLDYSRWYYGESGVGCDPFLPRPDVNLVSLGDVGLSAGCETLLAGKWHLGDDPFGGPWWQAPAAHGWQEFYGSGGNLDNCGGTDYFSWSRATHLGPPAITTVYQPMVNEADLLSRWDAIPVSKLFTWRPHLPHGTMHWPPPYTDDGVPENDFQPPGYHQFGGQRNRYVAMIAAFDMQLARVLQHLNPATDLVILLGDNGTPAQVSPFDNTPGGNGFPFPAKGTCAERGIRVPFILWGAGLRAKVSARMASAVDVLPTVAGYLGVRAPAGIDGVNLVGPVLRPYVISGIDAGTQSDYCIRTSQWKLRYKGQPRVEQAFNLVTDPNEHLPRPVSVIPLPILNWMRAKLVAAGVP